MTGSQLARLILEELDVIGASDTPDQNDVVYALGRANRVLDNWCAEFGPAYVNSITAYTLTPALQPHTIGNSSATWTVTQRPVSIEGINLVVSTTRTPLMPLSDVEWLDLSLPATTGAQPTHFNYRPTFPNGSVYFWPVPTAAYQVEILTRGLLAQLTLAGTAILPPGYQDALVLTAAEACAKHFHATPPSALEASKARGRIFAANARTPKLTSDAPGAACSGGFDYETGLAVVR